MTLDESFLVVRRVNAVTTSPELSGFHFYGTDLCLNAAVLRRTCYVIDFPLTHLSRGNRSPLFYAAKNAMVQSWAPRLWVGVVKTTCSSFSVSCNPLIRRLLNRPAVGDWIQRNGLGVIPRRNLPRTRAYTADAEPHHDSSGFSYHSNV